MRQHKLLKLAALVAAVVGTATVAAPVHAGGTTPSFGLYEYTDTSCGSGCSGTLGHFDLVNNTTDFVITGFAVGNPNASSAFTTRDSWSANVNFDPFSFGFGESAFVYTSSGNYLGQGSDSSFFWSAGGPPASPFVVEYMDTTTEASGSCSSVTGGGCNPVASIPEPSSLALLLAGLAGMGLMRRRREV